jgi:hypothetical protein
MGPACGWISGGVSLTFKPLVVVYVRNLGTKEVGWLAVAAVIKSTRGIHTCDTTLSIANVSSRITKSNRVA